ncbi:acetoacetate decarboxylase [Methylocystis sp. FS]|uniref:acetoacetate decarboxylase n=1 Tax=Methylocystis silviterrae TaxID=2743612 RepID=UPI0015832823|nr:acetoacetate decarboxylase [Methylocystis silviterrae]NUJ81336.1 acetoacetate decarboxylase [Methylocystis silviterrae]
MDAEDVKRAAFAMPMASPSFTRGPHRYTNREHLIVTYRTDRAKLEEATPEPLVSDDAIVRFEFMRMESGTGFGRYSGAAQHIPVKFAGQPGAYTHSMFLDAHGPISGGRELWGFPQKLAAPRLSVEHDTLAGTLDYGPARVATATMGYKHHALDETEAMRILQEPGFLLKIIPHVDGTPRICELVRYFRRDIVVRGAWSGPRALELHPHALAPVSDLPVLEIVAGVHLVADFTLDLGEVVFDYLAQ